MDAESYLSTANRRMLEGGYAAGPHDLAGGTALIGYRSDFRWSWSATKLHLFVAVKAVPAASRADIADFTSEVLAYGKKVKGRFRGLQTGVGVIAALVSAQVDEGAREFARHDLVRHFGAFAWPVVVDLHTERVLYQEGNPKIGRLYNDWMRTQINAVLSPRG